MGRTVAELEHTLSAAEYREWLAFYGLDPWGEQRADMRMARMVCATLAPHTKQQVSATDQMLFPDDAHDLPDDLSPEERRLFLQMNRM